MSKSNETGLTEAVAENAQLNTYTEQNLDDISGSTMGRLFTTGTETSSQSAATPVNNGWSLWSLFGYKSDNTTQAQASDNKAETTTPEHSSSTQNEVNIDTETTSTESITNETAITAIPEEKVPASTSFLAKIWNILTLQGNREEANKEIANLTEVQALSTNQKENIKNILEASTTSSVNDTMDKLTASVQVKQTGESTTDQGDTCDI